MRRSEKTVVDTIIKVNSQARRHGITTPLTLVGERGSFLGCCAFSRFAEGAIEDVESGIDVLWAVASPTGLIPDQGRAVRAKRWE